MASIHLPFMKLLAAGSCSTASHRNASDDQAFKLLEELLEGLTLEFEDHQNHNKFKEMLKDFEDRVG